MLCLQKLSKKLLYFVPSDEHRTPLIDVSVDECRCSTNSSWLRLLTYSVGRFSKDNATTVWTACADLKADLTNHEAANWLPEVAFNPDLATRSPLILSPFSFSHLTLRCLYKICLILTWKIRNCLLAYLCRLFKGFCQPLSYARSAVRVSAGGLATNAMARSFQANSRDTLNGWRHIRTRQGELRTRLLFCVRLPYTA